MTAYVSLIRSHFGAFGVFMRRIPVLLTIVCVMSLLASCHSSRKATSGQADPGIGQVHVGKIGKTQRKIIEEAYTWLGTPYRYAGVEKGEGTDCSGMVMKVYEKVTGEKLPRNSAKQAEYCIKVNASEVNTGDLVFFATGKDPGRVSHVGIVIDNENFIHASSSKGVVISKFTTDYYKRRFRMYGRVPRTHDLVSESN